MELTLQTLFPEPTSPDQAIRQCNIVERGQSLFSTGRYDWYISANDPHLFGVCGPKGQHYRVNMRENTCNCPGFQSDKDCKHRIAVSISEACYEASLIRQFELREEGCRF